MVGYLETPFDRLRANGEKSVRPELVDGLVEL